MSYCFSCFSFCFYRRLCPLMECKTFCDEPVLVKKAVLLISLEWNVHYIQGQPQEFKVHSWTEYQNRFLMYLYYCCYMYLFVKIFDEMLYEKCLQLVLVSCPQTWQYLTPKLYLFPIKTITIPQYEKYMYFFKALTSTKENPSTSIKMTLRRKSGHTKNICFLVIWKNLPFRFLSINN